MPQQVVSGAQTMCTFGTAPCSLVVLPIAMVNGSNMPEATIMDSAPIMNLPTFGMCSSPSNPTVAAATAAALGVLTPMPCIPATTPWSPGSSTIKVGGKPILNNTSKCNCAYGGVVSISNPGQTTINTD